LKDDIVQLWILENLPFRMIESQSWKHLMTSSNMIEGTMSASTLKRLIEDKYNEAKFQLKRLLDGTCVSISISLDAWTSPNNEAFLGIIGHWIGPEFTYYERFIDFVELEGSHTGENLKEVLQSTLKEFGLLSKLLTLTTDNASNNDKLAQLMNDHIDKLVEGGELLYKKFFGLESFVRCLAHIINLIVNDVMHALKVGQHKDVYRVFEDIERKRSLE
jgi:hypothetical protein